MFLENGAIKLLPAEFYDRADWTALRLWCHKNARYGLPTIELVDWLKKQIGNRKAIEIGAGSGDLCRHLGIIGTDNHMQEWPDVRLYYAATGQPVVKYGAWVERLDALEAVEKHKPDVVIGSWITHWIDPDLPVPPGGGNMYGVKEDEMLKLVDTYIMIGNLETHKAKPILNLPHEEFDFPWIKSRAKERNLNRIFVWR